MRKYIVAVDIDGVVWDLLTPWLARYCKISGDHITPDDVKSYDIESYIEGGHNELLHYVLEMEDFWDTVCLFDGVYEAVSKLNNNPKVDLVFVTATDYRVALKKFNRFFELLPMVSTNQLMIAPRKELIDVHYLIDDWECNLKHMAKSKRGMPVLITQPYNKSFPNNMYGITRTCSLCEAVDIILNDISKEEDLWKKLETM